MNSLLESIKYPQYRRYKNGLNYFKILSPILAEEIKIVGRKQFTYQIEAKQYPEKVFINDLLFKYAEFADEIAQEDYNNLI